MDFRGRVWVCCSAGTARRKATALETWRTTTFAARDGADEQAGQRARRVALADLLRDHLPFLFH
jgi:hypothetical protein